MLLLVNRTYLVNIFIYGTYLVKNRQKYAYVINEWPGTLDLMQVLNTRGPHYSHKIYMQYRGPNDTVSIFGDPKHYTLNDHCFRVFIEAVRHLMFL